MRRAVALRLLFPAGSGLLPIGQSMAGRLGAAPAAARRLDRGRVVAVEYVDAAGEIRDIFGFDAIDQEQDRRAVRVFGVVAEPDRMRRRVAVARGTMRQEARLVVSPEQRVQMLDALGGGGADHDAVAL